MRLTQILFKHNNYRLFEFKWLLYNKRVIENSNAVDHLKKAGIPLCDPVDIIKEVRDEFSEPKEPVGEIIGMVEKELPLNKDHPLYKPRECLQLQDGNVLLQGTNQAKTLLNTVQIEEGLPLSHENLIGIHTSKYQDKHVMRSIFSSFVYDGMQNILPKRKNPEKIEWVFPRDYGITALRKFELLTGKLLQLCDNALGAQSAVHRNVVSDALCLASLQKKDALVHLENTADVLVTSREPLSKLVDRDAAVGISLPDLYPLESTISIPPVHFYRDSSIFPIAKAANIPHPHTAIVRYSTEDVMNIYEEPVTEDQYFGRTLTKAFAIAASRAQQLYGEDVKKLPDPIVLQVVQTDGRRYHFGVLQLNTLDLDANDQRNVFWMHPSALDMFSVCDYVKGKPVLENYNPEVFARLLAFYANGFPST